MLHWFTLAFVVLKLIGFINWSWWLVILPSLIPVALAGILIILAALSTR